MLISNDGGIPNMFQFELVPGQFVVGLYNNVSNQVPTSDDMRLEFTLWRSSECRPGTQGSDKIFI